MRKTDSGSNCARARVRLGWGAPVGERLLRLFDVLLTFGVGDGPLAMRLVCWMTVTPILDVSARPLLLQVLVQPDLSTETMPEDDIISLSSTTSRSDFPAN